MTRVERGLRWLWVGVLLAGLGGALTGPVAAQHDVDAVRGKVQAWLLQTLGRPGMLLVQYTFEGMEWEDSSLGCPVEGETYQPELVSGYRWTFTFDNMVRYEVHSGLDGAPAVLCSAENAGPTLRLTAYTSPDFTILRPDAWLVFPGADGAGILFAPRPQLTCDVPGMRVVKLGRVAAGVTPDQLLDEHLQTLGVRDDLVGRASVGPYGRTTRVDAPCGSLRRSWRVSAFVQYGSAFRVEQWAPLEEFQMWDELFSTMLGQFGAVDSVLGASAAPGTAGGDAAETASGAPSTRAPLPLAHVFTGDVFVAALDRLPGLALTSSPAPDRRYLSFSPDGLRLAYTDVTNRRLSIARVDDGSRPTRVADGVSPFFPPAWSPDGARLAYAAPSGEPDAAGMVTLTIFTLLSAGSAAEPKASFPFPADCPAAASDPADAVYQQESAGQERVLAWLPDDRFLVSLGCETGLGVATGEGVQPLDDDLRGGALAPDATRFLARSGAGLALLDTATLTVNTLRLGASARQLAWGPDGQTVYYATAGLTDGLTLDDPADAARGQEFFGVWPVTIGLYDLALVKLDLATGQEGAIWRGQGRGIGRISAAPDGSGVLFSVVPSSAALVEVFQSEGDALARWAAWPTPALYWLAADTPAAVLLDYSGQPVFAPVTLQ